MRSVLLLIGKIEMEINEHDKWPEDKERYDFNYLTIFGYCQQNLCPKRKCCYRYQEKAGKNNVNWIPKQDDYSTCKFFSPAKCHYCNGTGYHRDFSKLQGKWIKTSCLICGGKKKLFPDKETERWWIAQQKGE
jgi:hypothetical protein